MASASNSVTLKSSAGGVFTLSSSIKEGTITDTHIANNTSPVTLSATLTAPGNSAFSSASENNKLQIFYYDNNEYSDDPNNGTLIDEISVTSCSKSNPKTITKTINVPHKSDGTLWGSIIGRWYKSGNHNYVPSTGVCIAGPITYTTIPRASTITAIDCDIESSTLITINRLADAFTTTLKYEFSSLSGTIVEKTTQLSYGWTVPSTFYAEIPDAKFGTCKIIAETYNGDTLIGTTTTTFKCTANEEMCKPVIVNSSVIDTNNVSINATGNANIIVSNISIPKVTIETQGQKSATIVSYKIVCDDGQQITLPTDVTEVSAIFDRSVTKGTFTLSVTDSRGYSNQVVIAKDFISYIPLTISADFSRVSPTNGEVQVVYSGNYYPGLFNDSSDSANTLEIRYRYRDKTNNEEFSDEWYTLTPTISGNTFEQRSAIKIPGEFIYTSDFEFEIQALDKIYTSGQVALLDTVIKGETVYWWNKTSFNVEVDLYVKGQKINT